MHPSIERPISESVPTPQSHIPGACAAHEAGVWRERFDRWQSGSLDAQDDAYLIRSLAIHYAHKMAYLLEQGQ